MEQMMAENMDLAKDEHFEKALGMLKKFRSKQRQKMENQRRTSARERGDEHSPESEKKLKKAHTMRSEEKTHTDFYQKRSKSKYKNEKTTEKVNSDLDGILNIKRKAIKEKPPQPIGTPAIDKKPLKPPTSNCFKKENNFTPAMVVDGCKNVDPYLPKPSTLHTTNGLITIKETKLDKALKNDQYKKEFQEKVNEIEQDVKKKLKEERV